jgi:hypothetical protein
MTLIETLEAAFAAGTVTLAQISACDEVGFDFQADSFDCLSEEGARSVLAELGLIDAATDTARDIYDINADAARQLARFAGIRGA